MSEGGFAYGDPRAHAVAELRSAFADFSRNGRWGTCGECPCDGYGRKLPELCAFTRRDDHQLDIDALSRRFKQEVSAFVNAGNVGSFCKYSVPFGPGTQKCACHGVATASFEKDTATKGVP
jgi:hypothetical protein